MIGLQKFRELLVGMANVVPTDHAQIPYLIVATTMRVPKIITDPADIMLATRAPPSVRRLGISARSGAGDARRRRGQRGCAKAFHAERMRPRLPQNFQFTVPLRS
jgi:hypothetical protein